MQWRTQCVAHLKGSGAAGGAVIPLEEGNIIEGNVSVQQQLEVIECDGECAVKALALDSSKIPGGYRDGLSRLGGFRG